MKRFVVLLLLSFFIVSMLFLGTGCQQAAAETTAAETTAAASGDYGFTFICKKLTDEWFKVEVAAMERTAQELGVKYNGIDANYNDELCMAAVDNVIVSKEDGVVICVTNQGLGPAVAKKFEEAGIPLIAIDDRIEDESGNPVPYVGIPGYESGISTGEALIKLATERGFFNEGNNWKILIGDIVQVLTTHEMATGYQETFMKGIPGITEDDIVVVDTKTGSYDDSIATITSAFNAHPEVSHWILATTDDQIGFASVKMLIEQNFDFKNALVSGWGAYGPSKDIFLMGENIANSYISLSLNPDKEGENAIRFLYDYVANGVEIPIETTYAGDMIDVNNWQKYFGN